MNKETKMTYRREKVRLKKFILYFAFYQLSSAVTILFFYLFPNLNIAINVILSNLLSGLISFWITRLIFQKRHLRMRMWDYK